MNKNISLEKLATIVSSITAFLLLVIKLFIWIFSWSISVLSSAIDSLLDIFVSIFNFFAIKNSELDADEKFNYWRWKIEALASLFEWIIISLSGLYIIYESVMKIINKDEILYLKEAILVMIISVIITWTLVLFLEKVAKKTNNLVIKSDALHYKTDLYTNAWILIALILISFTHIFYIDSIIWFIVWWYIIYLAYNLIKNWTLLILDVSLNKEEVNKIIKIIEKQELINDYHFLKTRQSWKYKFVDVHIVFNPMIKLIDAHNISNIIEEKIEKIDKSKKWVFNIHLDPYDDSEINEKKCNVFFNKT